MFILGVFLGIGGTLFVVRFKDSLRSLTRRVEKDIEKNLKGE